VVKLETSIIQTRNDNDWFFMQSFSIIIKGQMTELCYSCVTNYGKTISRWYHRPHEKYFVIIGIAENDDAENGITKGDEYLSIKTFAIPDQEEYIFKSDKRGIYILTNKVDVP